jgi:hypothetical protein
LVCSEFHERSVAKDSHGCALCCQSRLWGFHRWRAVENIAAMERENPVPGSSSSVQVGGLQVGSRVVYLDVLGISLRFGIVVSLCFFHILSLSPTFPNHFLVQGCCQQNCALRSPQRRRR